MGISTKVFDDTLPNASKPYLIVKTSSGYELTNTRLSVTITLSEQTPRKIAGLTIPVTHVVLNFHGHDTIEIEEYMIRFKRYFHRGGG